MMFSVMFSADIILFLLFNCCFSNPTYFCFSSPEASLLNKQIFETLYYGAMESSCELAEKEGPYQTYEGCPVSKGIFQVTISC
jgi:hypothetical protein